MQHLPYSHRAKVSAQGGMTLVEIMVSLLIITVASYILTSTIMASVAHSASKKEKNIAAEAATNMIERIRACPPQDIYALYNDFAGDDPYGPGTAPGQHFAVAGLDPMLDARGEPLPLGTILMPGNAGVLDETAVDARFGLPRDLDGSMFVEAGDVSGSYLLLPITVRVEWLGKLGPRKVEIATVVVDSQRIEP